MRDKRLNDLIKKYEGGEDGLSDETRMLRLSSAIAIKKSQPHIWYGLFCGYRSPMIIVAALIAAATYPLMALELFKSFVTYNFFTPIVLLCMSTGIYLLLIYGIARSLGVPFSTKCITAAFSGMLPIELIPGAKKIDWYFLYESRCEIFIESKMNHILVFYALITGKSFSDAEKDMYNAVVRDFENAADSIGSHFGIPIYIYVFSAFLLVIIGWLFDINDTVTLMFTFPSPMFFVSILLSWLAFSNIMLLTSMCHWIQGRSGLSDEHPLNRIGFVRMIALVILIVYVNQIGFVLYGEIVGIPDWLN